MQDILEKIKSSKHVLIMGHEDPDGDSIGSSWALGHILERMGIKATLCSPGPFRKRETIPYTASFSKELPPLNDSGSPDLLVLLDCSGLSRTGYDPEILKSLPMVVIDHHAAGNPVGPFSLVRPNIPSTTLIIQDIGEALVGKLLKEEADALFLGFCTDTDYFRHVGKDSAKVFMNISRLTEYGINPSEMEQQLQPVYSSGTVRLMGRILERATWYYSGKLAVSQDSFRDRRELETDDRNSALIYKILFSVENTKAIILMQEKEPGRWLIGLRSKGDLDVASIAADLGGGGHKNASGCEIINPTGENPLEMILEHFKRVLE